MKKTISFDNVIDTNHFTKTNQEVQYEGDYTTRTIVPSDVWDYEEIELASSEAGLIVYIELKLLMEDSTDQVELVHLNTTLEEFELFFCDLCGYKARIPIVEPELELKAVA